MGTHKGPDWDEIERLFKRADELIPGLKGTPGFEPVQKAFDKAKEEIRKAKQAGG
jgi:hypothetical protein